MSNMRAVNGNNLVTKASELVSMFHPTLNTRDPETYTPMSNNKAWWICLKDSTHVWEAAVCDVSRASKKTRGCPFCSGHKTTLTTSLEYNSPELAKEFDEIKNECTAKDVSYHASKQYWWLCSTNPSHSWATSIRNRVVAESRCPYCAKCKPSTEYNLLACYPEIAKELDVELTGASPEEFTPHSGKRVYWKCSTCFNSWTAIITSRTGLQAGCPRCSKQGYSRAQVEWLQWLQTPDSHIQHCANGGEYFIPKVGKVDGYCVSTNTVYEYHGDFWHGNPLRFDGDDINQVNKKSYSQLFAETLQRDRLILSLGYKLIVRWETEYPAYTKLLHSRRVTIRIINKP